MAAPGAGTDPLWPIPQPGHFVRPDRLVAPLWPSPTMIIGAYPHRRPESCARAPVDFGEWASPTPFRWPSSRASERDGTPPYVASQARPYEMTASVRLPLAETSRSSDDQFPVLIQPLADRPRRQRARPRGVRVNLEALVLRYGLAAVF